MLFLAWLQVVFLVCFPVVCVIVTFTVPYPEFPSSDFSGIRLLSHSINSLIQSERKSLNACKFGIAVRSVLGCASSLVQKSLFLQFTTRSA